MQYEIPGQTTDDFDTDVGNGATRHTTAIGVLDLAVLIPYKAGTVITRTSTAADVTAAICDYDGYADEAIVWSTVSRGNGSLLRYEGIGAQMRPSGSAHPNSVGGFALLNTAKSKVYMVFPATTPIPMRDALDAVSPQVNFAPSGGVSLAVTI